MEKSMQKREVIFWDDGLLSYKPGKFNMDIHLFWEIAFVIIPHKANAIYKSKFPLGNLDEVLNYLNLEGEKRWLVLQMRDFHW